MIRFRVVKKGDNPEILALRNRSGGGLMGVVSVLRRMPDCGELGDNLTIQLGMISDGYLDTVNEGTSDYFRFEMGSKVGKAYYTEYAYLVGHPIGHCREFLFDYPQIMAGMSPHWRLNAVRIRPRELELCYRDLNDGVCDRVFLRDDNLRAKMDVISAGKMVTELEILGRRQNLLMLGEVKGYQIKWSRYEDGNVGWRALYICAPVDHPEQFYIQQTYTLGSGEVEMNLADMVCTDNDGYCFCGF